MLLDEGKVAAEDSTRADVLVMDSYRETFADESFHDLYRGAFPQIVGIVLETEAQYANLAGAVRQNRSKALFNMRLVASLDGGQRGSFHVPLPADVKHRSEVLRQAGSAVSVAGLEVTVRNIELAILAEDLHHLVRIDAHRLAERADLIAEDNFQRMEDVAGVLYHDGFLEAHAEDRRLDAFVKCHEGVPRSGL